MGWPMVAATLEKRRGSSCPVPKIYVKCKNGLFLHRLQLMYPGMSQVRTEGSGVEKMVFKALVFLWFLKNQKTSKGRIFWFYGFFRYCYFFV